MLEKFKHLWKKDNANVEQLFFTRRKLEVEHGKKTGKGKIVKINQSHYVVIPKNIMQALNRIGDVLSMEIVFVKDPHNPFRSEIKLKPVYRKRERKF